MSELNEKMDFEEAYAALREVVTQMEDPNNKIEENIALYEKACRLVLFCRRTDINERIAQLKDSGDDIFED